MYWEQSFDDAVRVVPDRIIDLSYRLTGRAVPLDHAWALRQAVVDSLPWMADAAGCGIHPIHVASSGNGWMRPERGKDAIIHMSRRTRLVLRIPKTRRDDAQALVGSTLRLGGDCRIGVGAVAVKPLSAITTVFSRYVVSDAAESESDFIERVAQCLRHDLAVRPRKLLCGSVSAISTPNGVVRTRQVLLSDLEHDEAVRLQQRGLGPHRLLGCGLFIPHKGIAPVGETDGAA